MKNYEETTANNTLGMLARFKSHTFGGRWVIRLATCFDNLFFKFHNGVTMGIYSHFIMQTPFFSEDLLQWSQQISVGRENWREGKELKGKTIRDVLLFGSTEGQRSQSKVSSTSLKQGKSWESHSFTPVPKTIRLSKMNH